MAGQRTYDKAQRRRRRRASETAAQRRARFERQATALEQGAANWDKLTKAARQFSEDQAYEAAVRSGSFWGHLT